MKNLVIYSIVNVITGERYIGQTHRGLSTRKSEHTYRFNLGERDHKLYQVMAEYGIENFEFEILFHCFKPEYLEEMEVYFIKHFDTFSNGYNMTCGSDVSDETRAKLSAILKGRKAPWAENGKIIEIRRRNGTLFGCENRKGADHWKATSYLVKSPDGSEQVIKGLRQFCREHGLSHNLMLAVLNGAQRHHKGYSLLARFND